MTEIKSNQIKSNQIKSNQINSNQIKSTQADYVAIQSFCQPLFRTFSLFCEEVFYHIISKLEVVC